MVDGKTLHMEAQNTRLGVAQSIRLREAQSIRLEEVLSIHLMEAPSIHLMEAQATSRSTLLTTMVLLALGRLWLCSKRWPWREGLDLHRAEHRAMASEIMEPSAKARLGHPARLC